MPRSRSICPLDNPMNAPRGRRLPRLAQGEGMMGNDAKRDALLAVEALTRSRPKRGRAGARQAGAGHRGGKRAHLWTPPVRA
jgi:hypothetical protein